MTDQELLEFAAKAAGYDFITVEEHDTGDWIAAWKGRESIDWNPLIDDGDAFRLMVKLSLGVSIPVHKTICADVICFLNSSVNVREEGGNRYAATRRAIVRAAAEIGRG